MSKKLATKKPKKEAAPVITTNGTEEVPTFEITKPKNLASAGIGGVAQGNPYEKTQEETPVLVRKANREDVKASKPAPVTPFVGPKEKLFECPFGCLKTGPADRNEDYCSNHDVKINPKR